MNFIQRLLFGEAIRSRPRFKVQSAERPVLQREKWAKATMDSQFQMMQRQALNAQLSQAYNAQASSALLARSLGMSPPVGQMAMMGLGGWR